MRNPVRDRLHLNVAEDGSMSPFSAVMARMSPHRVSGVAVDAGDNVVGTPGARAEPARMDPGLAALLAAIGDDRASVQDVGRNVGPDT